MGIIMLSKVERQYENLSKRPYPKYGVRGVPNPIIQPSEGNVAPGQTSRRIIGISRCDLMEETVGCIKELTFKFSGSAAGLLGGSFPFLGVDSIEGHNRVSGKGFPTTGPRIKAGNVVIHRGLHVSNVTASCSLCAIGCKELFADRHRCPDVRYIVVMSMGYVVDWNCMLMDFTNLKCTLLDASYGITGLTRASFGITRLICASFGITRLICASFGITRLIGVSFGVRVQRGADRREAGRMREGHMDASGFLYASADVFC
ncbi:hypothetical protein E5676_scaffold119G001810 [Cucumis melo var. makuwa]|uniref:Ty3-gypsy retrotransposon protein n=1 Tax=Cucumis melo var. makuwa TaxID=1194695 RepID=A0A5D3D526_CUCMM|nr:hypothetical protein E5676_scaffold119G001810 [Cucumis melo var. makuwa]